jgi:hypothetical protein
MSSWKPRAVVVCLDLLAIFSVNLQAQQDPGPRSGPAGAGSYFTTLNSLEQSFYMQSQQHFMEVDSVSGSIPSELGRGLGPTFNGNSCAQCHVQPATGGSSPGLSSVRRTPYRIRRSL